MIDSKGTVQFLLLEKDWCICHFVTIINSNGLRKIQQFFSNLKVITPITNITT